MKWLVLCAILFVGCDNPCKCIERICHMQPVIIDDMVLFMKICNCRKEICPTELGGDRK